MKADPQTEKEILAALERFNEVVQNRDLESAVALFLPDDETSIVTSQAGLSAKGANGLRAVLEQGFSGPFRYAFFWDDCHISSCGDVAWVFATGRLQTTSQAGVYEHPYRMTSVLCRSGSKWLWAHYHGSEPAG